MIPASDIGASFGVHVFSPTYLTAPVMNVAILSIVRASRLVNVLLLLQTRSRMTAGELAEELEVSVRTIYRDVDALAEAGVPIYAERGPHGGVRLVDGYRTRLTGLTADEAEAVFLSGVPGPAAELGLGTVVAAARLKVMAALPPELRTRAGRVAERFHLDAPGWFQSSEELRFLELLAGAVWEAQRVQITYRRGERAGTVERTIEPLGLVLKGGVWYVVARTADSVRTYRVSRVLEAALLGERFVRPEGFELAAHWAQSRTAYEQSVERIEVVIRLPPDQLSYFGDAAGDRAMADSSRSTDPADANFVILRLAFDWADEAIAAALRMSDAVEVIEPAWLRQAIVDSARRILARYSEESAVALPG
jgi:predicted DNA-binding transcriptional regulator YafY